MQYHEQRWMHLPQSLMLISTVVRYVISWRLLFDSGNNAREETVEVFSSLDPDEENHK
jgi:hypothetical protein